MSLFDALSSCRTPSLLIIAIIPASVILLPEMSKFFSLHLPLKAPATSFAPLLVI